MTRSVERTGGIKAPSRAAPTAAKPVVLKPKPLPAEAVARIRAIMAWEDAGEGAEFTLGPIRRPPVSEG